MMHESNENKRMNEDKLIRFFTALCLAGCFALLLSVIFLFCLSGIDTSVLQVKERHRFGATYMTMNNPYYQLLDEQIRMMIEANGDVLLSRDASMDQNKQNEQIKELIDADVEVLFLTPVEWDSVQPGLQLAYNAGIPVIIVDTPVKDHDLVACSVLSDNYQAGVLCGEHLLSIRDSANILLLEHVTAESGKERIQGFLDTIAGHEGFNVLGSGESDGQIENALPVMEQLLKEHPEADTLMALTDPSAFGGMAAIRGAGLTDRFLVYGVDGTPEAKGMVKDGMMTATCAQFPLIVSEKSVEQGYKILREGVSSYGKEVVVPVELVTSENVDHFNINGWQ